MICVEYTRSLGTPTADRRRGILFLQLIGILLRKFEEGFTKCQCRDSSTCSTRMGFCVGSNDYHSLRGSKFNRTLCSILDFVSAWPPELCLTRAQISLICRCWPLQYHKQGALNNKLPLPVYHHHNKVSILMGLIRSGHTPKCLRDQSRQTMSSPRAKPLTSWAGVCLDSRLHYRRSIPPIPRQQRARSNMGLHS